MKTNTETRWTDLAKKHLVGCKIVKVQYMSEDEVDEMMWYKSPLC